MYNSRRPERVYGCKLNFDVGGSAPFVHPVPGRRSDDDVLPLLLGDGEDAIIITLSPRPGAEAEREYWRGREK